jgi:hypothetical protein
VWIYSSITAGGGVYGRVDGIVRIIMTEVGVILIMFHDSIPVSIQVGEDTIKTIVGEDISGTMNGFVIKDSNRTGKAGILHNIGQNKKATVFRIINLEMCNGNLIMFSLNSPSLNTPSHNTPRLNTPRLNTPNLNMLSHNMLNLEENMKGGRGFTH